jgi:AcrR family transcriptional regulator
MGNMSETKPRKRLAADARKALIVDAAGRLFGERGFDGTRLDDVAAAAGVTKPIVYRHFETKQDLYLTLLARHRDDLDRFGSAIPPDGTIQERIRAVLEVWVTYVEGHSYAWRMLFRDTGGGLEIDAFRREVHARARAVLVELIGLLAEVPVPPREREPLAELMSMGMASLVLWWLENPDTSRGAMIDAMTRAWTGLLTTEAA